MVLDASDLQKLVAALGDALRAQLAEANAANVNRIDAGMQSIREEFENLAKSVDARMTGFDATVRGLGEHVTQELSTVEQNYARQMSEFKANSLTDSATSAEALLTHLSQAIYSTKERDAELAQAIDSTLGELGDLRTSVGEQLAGLKAMVGEIPAPAPSPELLADGEFTPYAAAFVETLARQVIGPLVESTSSGISERLTGFVTEDQLSSCLMEHSRNTGVLVASAQDHAASALKSATEQHAAVLVRIEADKQEMIGRLSDLNATVSAASSAVEETCAAAEARAMQCEQTVKDAVDNAEHAMKLLEVKYESQTSSVGALLNAHVQRTSEVRDELLRMVEGGLTNLALKYEALYTSWSMDARDKLEKAVTGCGAVSATVQHAVDNMNSQVSGTLLSVSEALTNVDIRAAAAVSGLREEFEQQKEQASQLLAQANAALETVRRAAQQSHEDLLIQADGFKKDATEVRAAVEEQVSGLRNSLDEAMEQNTAEVRLALEASLLRMQEALSALPEYVSRSQLDTARQELESSVDIAVETLKSGIEDQLVVALQHSKTATDAAIEAIRVSISQISDTVGPVAASAAETAVRGLEERASAVVTSAAGDAAVKVVQDMEARLGVKMVDTIRTEVSRIPPPTNGKDARVESPVPYEAGKLYESGRWVQHAGGVWVAARVTAEPPAPGSAHWDCVAPGLATLAIGLGSDGRTLKLAATLADGRKDEHELALPVPIIRDEPYTEAAEYAEHDLVQYDGGLWEARAGGKLPRPGTTTDWKLRIKKGKDGRPGKDQPHAAWRMRGAWEMDMACAAGDIVEHAGVHWLALKSTHDRPPFMRLVSNDVWLKLGS